jgi:hypothetical protein
MRTRVVALVIATALFALAAGCGGDDDSASDVTAEMTTAATSQSTGTVSSAALAGTWAATSEPFVVRFTPDGSFAMDGDGSVDDGVYVEGTYAVEGSRVRFTDTVGPRGCGGLEWEWEISLSESGMLNAENLEEVCQTAAGTRWSLEKRPGS